MRITRGIISESLAWSALAAFLAIGVPIFICMPLWVDTTYHDMSARNVLWGGVHYRDIFETNLPGMVWVHAALRPLIGWSSEAIRAADLVVVSASVLLIIWGLGRLGVSRAGRIWFAAAAALFYIFETEFIHCQRDMWMLFPTLVALHLRGRQVADASVRSNGSAFRHALFEGIAWACAVWIKPHCLIPALVVWLASLGSLRGSRRALADFLGLATGGLIAGALGSLWLIRTGAWPYMWDVLLNWNGEYYNWSLREMDGRMSMVIMYFAPWSLVHYLSLPVAVASLIRARVWRAVPGDGGVKMGQALLAALYLGWFLQATFLQKSFHYSNAPVLLLALAVLASYRWPVAQLFIAWCLIGGGLHHYRDQDSSLFPWIATFENDKPNTAQQVIPRHKLLNREWQSVWRRCVMRGSDPAMKDYLSFYHNNHCTPGWSDLNRVRVYLETLQLKDGELLCWDDSTHPLYLDLKLRPAIRYMHVNTVLDFRSKRELIREEVIHSGARYVVGDLAVAWSFYGYCPGWAIEEDTLALPPDFPCFCTEIFPWNQPMVFRAGRYVVMRIEKPIGEVRLPYPVRLRKP